MSAIDDKLTGQDLHAAGQLPGYGRHPSNKLNDAYKGYQGQKPEEAQYIFWGLDANFAADIEDNPAFPEVLDYLNDGVTYWKHHGRHHPFLSSAYARRAGRTYHRNFSKLRLTVDYADKISFVELLKFPTHGNTDVRVMRQMIAENPEHLRELDELLFTPTVVKNVYIARGAYRHLYNVGQAYNCFAVLPAPDQFNINTLYQVGTYGSAKFYVTTHFSDAISDNHLAEIRATIV
jgi:hypothetical protein